MPDWVTELLARKPEAMPRRPHDERSTGPDESPGDRYSQPGSTLSERQAAARVLVVLAEKHNEPVPDWVTELLARTPETDARR
ncbi:hypothetical protein AAFP30_08215 [Gordonia sp. CPCC 205515]|uniref:hypothetical protein n=1 Tax=Gordonia sp. CPCC 205515 TaxID=3140791 RepID=UPI003AF3B217